MASVAVIVCGVCGSVLGAGHDDLPHQAHATAPVAELVQQSLEGRPRALGDALDRSIDAVSHVAGKAGLVCSLQYEVAEPDALDAAADDGLQSSDGLPRLVF